MRYLFLLSFLFSASTYGQWVNKNAWFQGCSKGARSIYKSHPKTHQKGTVLAALTCDRIKKDPEFRRNEHAPCIQGVLFAYGVIHGAQASLDLLKDKSKLKHLARKCPKEEIRLIDQLIKENTI